MESIEFRSIVLDIDVAHLGDKRAEATKQEWH